MIEIEIKKTPTVEELNKKLNLPARILSISEDANSIKFLIDSNDLTIGSQIGQILITIYRGTLSKTRKITKEEAKKEFFLLE
jgi:hypothetical protein